VLGNNYFLYGTLLAEYIVVFVAEVNVCYFRGYKFQDLPKAKQQTQKTGFSLSGSHIEDNVDGLMRLMDNGKEECHSIST